MKRSSVALRGGADAANLLVDRWRNYCGKALQNSIGSGRTISVVRKDCAAARYVLGHEIGHNIGLDHEMAKGGNKHYPYGHAHQISHSPDSESPKYRTIVGAGGKKSERPFRGNYYSNPDIIFPLTGTPTGVAGVSNNARILMENRFALANIGDETTPCSISGTNKYLYVCPLYHPLQ